MPAKVECSRLRANAGVIQLGIERIELAERALEPRRVADYADALPHRVVELLADRFDVASRKAEWPLVGSDVELRRRREASMLAHPFGHRVARDRAEHR